MSGPVQNTVPDAGDAHEKEVLEHLLDALSSRWGYDFRGYARASLLRRLRNHCTRAGYADWKAMKAATVKETAAFTALLCDLTVNVSDMFRDPHVFRALKQKVFPLLATWPSMRIWHAGCAGGEEVYTLAILLEEAGLLKHSIIYATDLSPAALKKAKDGIYPAENLRPWSSYYQSADGDDRLMRYFTVSHDHARVARFLRERIVFAEHNLVVDGSLGEMQLLLCRNVLIYFGPELKTRVLKLFDETLCHGGHLVLGTKESLVLTVLEQQYTEIERGTRIYKKLY